MFSMFGCGANPILPGHNVTNPAATQPQHGFNNLHTSNAGEPLGLDDHPHSMVTYRAVSADTPDPAPKGTLSSFGRHNTTHSATHRNGCSATRGVSITSHSTTPNRAPNTDHSGAFTTTDGPARRTNQYITHSTTHNTSYNTPHNATCTTVGTIHSGCPPTHFWVLVAAFVGLWAASTLWTTCVEPGCAALYVIAADIALLGLWAASAFCSTCVKRGCAALYLIAADIAFIGLCTWLGLASPWAVGPWPTWTLAHWWGFYHPARYPMLGPRWSFRRVMGLSVPPRRRPKRPSRHYILPFALLLLLAAPWPVRAAAAVDPQSTLHPVLFSHMRWPTPPRTATSTRRQPALQPHLSFLLLLLMLLLLLSSGWALLAVAQAPRNAWLHALFSLFSIKRAPVQQHTSNTAPSASKQPRPTGKEESGRPQKSHQRRQRGRRGRRGRQGVRTGRRGPRRGRRGGRGRQGRRGASKPRRALRRAPQQLKTSHSYSSAPTWALKYLIWFCLVGTVLGLNPVKQPAPQAMFRFHRQFLLLSSGWAWLAVAQAQRNALLHALCGNGPGNVTDYTCFVTLVDACVPGVHKVKVTCLPTVQAFVAALHRQISALLWSAPVEAIGVANKWRHEVWDKTEGFQDWVALDDDEQLELVFKVRASRKEVPIKAPTTPSPAGPPTPPTAAPLPPPTALPSAPANAPSTMPPITPLVAPHGNDHQPLCTMNPASEAPDVAGQNSGLPVQAAQRGPSMMGDHQPLCPMDPASEAPDAASDNPVPARQNSGLPVRAAQRGPSVMSMMDDNDSKPQSPRPTARMMDDQNGPSAPITSVNVRAVKGRFGREPYTWQIQVWEALAQRKDALVVVPTGAGKSLCYQAYTTATGKKGCCLVVSPLVSLMVNQVEQQLQPLHFDAIFLGSQQTCATTKRVLDDCIQGVRQLPDFVYVTPEYLCGTENELRMLRSRFALFAVDEVHEVLDSSTYREAFTQLPKVLRSLSSGEVPIILTSATIRKQDTGHLQQMFSMTSTCHTFFRPMDRTDLALSFRQKKGKPEEDLGWLPTCDGKTIVFCTSKADRPDSAEEIADMLNKVGTATIARPYHKDLSQHDREKALADFTNGVITVLVVTSALSVGFDTDGVKRVIFYGVPSTLNTWVQVAGRCARRPHEKGDIHVFWTFKDFNIFSFYYGNIERNVHREDVATAQERVLTNAKNMFRLYSTCGCYRRWLATFYGVELVDGDCGECSNCKQGAPQDMTDLAFQILTRLPRNQLLLITHLKFLLLGRSSGYMTKMNWDADFKSSMALPDKWKALPESTILAVLYALIDKGLVDLVVEYNKHNMSFKVGTIDNGCQWVANSNREPILCHATHGKPMQTGTQKRSLPAVRQLIGTDTSTHIDVIEANEDECLNKVQLNRVYVAKEPLPLGTGPHHLFHNLNVCHDKVTVTTAGSIWSICMVKGCGAC